MSKRTILLASLVISLSALVCAQNNSATVVASGDVSINGKRVERTGEIFQSEVLDTHDNGVASMTTHGTIVSVAKRTGVSWEQNALQLHDCGTVEVSTVKKFVSVAHDVISTPTSDGNTRYRVQQRNRKVRVEVMQGAVNVVQGDKTTPLAAAQSAVFDNNVECKEPIAAGWVLGPIWGATTIPIFWPHGHEPITPMGP
jgi:hypothetical protein